MGEAADKCISWRMVGYSSGCSGIPALGVGHARGTGVGVGGLQKTFGRSAHPSLLKDAQTPGSSPWLHLPFRPGTFCPPQPD